MDNSNFMDSLSKNIKAVLGLVIIVFCFAFFVLAMVLFKDDKTIVMGIIVAVVSALSAATGYYFGSSSGSTKKDETIATALKQPTVNNSTIAT